VDDLFGMFLMGISMLDFSNSWRLSREGDWQEMSGFFGVGFQSSRKLKSRLVWGEHDYGVVNEIGFSGQTRDVGDVEIVHMKNRKQVDRKASKVYTAIWAYRIG
jgi:hypothetical protein